MRYEPHQLHEELDRALSSKELQALHDSLDELPAQQEAWDDALALHSWVQETLCSAEPPPGPSAQAAWQRLQKANPEVKRTIAPPAPRRDLWQWLAGLRWAVAAAAVMAMVWLPQRGSLDQKQPHATPARASVASPAFVHKGAQPIFRMLHAYRRHDLQGTAYAPAAHTANNALLRPGDLVQFSYKLPGPMHVMILSLNQQGELFSFVPFRGTQSVKLEASGTIPKGNSLVLDRYIGAERFFMVASEKAFTFQQINYALQRIWQRQGKRLDTWPRARKDLLLKGWHVTTLLIHKRHHALLPQPKEDQR